MIKKRPKVLPINKSSSLPPLGWYRCIARDNIPGEWDEMWLEPLVIGRRYFVEEVQRCGAGYSCTINSGEWQYWMENFKRDP